MMLFGVLTLIQVRLTKRATDLKRQKAGKAETRNTGGIGHVRLKQYPQSIADQIRHSQRNDHAVQL